MRVYTAGPMTWHPQFNYPAFIELARLLRADGYEVISPAELDDPDDRAAALASPDGDPRYYSGKSTWGDFLARDVKLIADDGIEAIVVLPGWDSSRGARLETFVGYLSGLPILYRDPNPPHMLHPVADIALFRAWAQEPHLRITRPFAGARP